MTTHGKNTGAECNAPAAKEGRHSNDRQLARSHGHDFQMSEAARHGQAAAMVVSNHPLASAAGAEMPRGRRQMPIDAGGFRDLVHADRGPNRCMVGIIGGGMAHIRLTERQSPLHRWPEHGSACPCGPTPIGRSRVRHMDVFDNRRPMNNLNGPKAVPAVRLPGSLKAWCGDPAKVRARCRSPMSWPPADQARVARLRGDALPAMNASPTARPRCSRTSRSRRFICRTGCPLEGRRPASCKSEYAETLDLSRTPWRGVAVSRRARRHLRRTT